MQHIQKQISLGMMETSSTDEHQKLKDLKDSNTQQLLNRMHGEHEKTPGTYKTNPNLIPTPNFSNDADDIELQINYSRDMPHLAYPVANNNTTRLDSTDGNLKHSNTSQTQEKKEFFESTSRRTGSEKKKSIYNEQEVDLKILRYYKKKIDSKLQELEFKKKERKEQEKIVKEKVELDEKRSNPVSKHRMASSAKYDADSFAKLNDLHIQLRNILREYAATAEKCEQLNQARLHSSRGQLERNTHENSNPRRQTSAYNQTTKHESDKRVQNVKVSRKDRDITITLSLCD